MAPVKVAGGQAIWTRDTVDQALRDYAEMYGDDFTAAAFSPSTAKWRDDELSIERYYAGNPRQDGKAWPSLNTIKAFHGGSFNAARVAVGLQANSPGPASKRRARGKHRPVRDIRERVHTVIVERHADNRLSVEQAASKQKKEIVRVEVPSPRDARLRAQATKAETRLAVATERLRAARDRAREAQKGRKAAERTAAARARRVEAAEQALAAHNALRGALSDAERKLAAQARASEHADAEYAAALAEREQTIHELQNANGMLAAELELADPAEMARARTEVEGARERIARARAGERDAGAREQAADRARRAAEARADKATREQAHAERERREVQEAAVGHARPLTPAEVAELREKGPQGPAIFMGAVKDVVNAHAKGERQKLREALRRAAAACVGWSGRL